MTIEEDNTKTHRMAEEKIEVSVVMPCLNEQATISYCIEKAQTNGHANSLNGIHNGTDRDQM